MISQPYDKITSSLAGSQQGSKRSADGKITELLSTQNLGVTPSSLSLSLVDALQVAAKHGCQSQGQGWVLREYERVGKNKLGVLITNYPYGDRTTATGPPCMLLETLDRELLIMGKLILM